MPATDGIPTSSRQGGSVALIVAILALALAAVGLFVPRTARDGAEQVQSENTLQQVVSRRVLRVGYEGYPPYTVTDPATGRLSGYSVDLAEYIAQQAGWSVQWIKTSADTKIPDLQAGRFDVMVEPIFETISRASRVSFSRPYAYFGDAVGVVRKGETRFKNIDALNRPGVTVAVRQGYTDQEFATDNLPNAKVTTLKVNDASQLFLEVIADRADVALADLEQARAFVAAHPTQVELRFANPAPVYIPAGFMFRQGDFTFYNFMNSAIGYAESNGVLRRLDRKYNVTSTGHLPSGPE
jgi:cyclohexadienyl dehydratase